MKSLKIISRCIVSVIAIFALVLAFFPGHCWSSDSGSISIKPSKGQKVNEATREKILKKYGKIPLYFVKNRGQIKDRAVRFYSKAGNTTTYFTDDGVVIQAFRYKDKGARSIQKIGHKPGASRAVEVSTLRLGFMGANEIKVQGDDKQPGIVNYFIGRDRSRWISGIPTYARLIYRDLYDKIDLIYQGTPAGLKYEIRVHPGADIKKIQLAYAGAEGLSLDEMGNLIIRTALGNLIDKSPYAYQEIDGNRIQIPTRFRLQPQPTRNQKPETGNGSKAFIYGFDVISDYDHSLPLIIDPTLSYSTYLGGSDGDNGRGIVVDGSGNAYVTGATWSDDFPTQNPLQAASAGAWDAFVAKLNPTDGALVYSTYLGGSNKDYGFGIAVDSSGNAYVTGRTWSDDFPTQNPLQVARVSEYDVFVAKLDATGSALVYSTYLGGDYSDEGWGIAVDGSGNAYVTGVTDSSDFPTQNPFQADNAGGEDSSDAFVAKLNATGNALVYSTYLGGSSEDDAYGIAVDGSGNAYVTGATPSDDFPTQNPFQGARAGGTDAFVAKLNAAGSALVYSTYLGGGALDRGEGIAVDGSGNAYVTGYTYSTDFPTQNPFQATNAGSADAFIAKLDATGSTLDYATYLGGISDDRSFDIAVDGSRNAYMTGYATSNDFPTQNPFQAANAGATDAFVAKFSLEDLGLPPPGVPEVLKVGATFKEIFGVIHGGSSPYLEAARAFLESRGMIFSFTDEITGTFLASVDAFYLGLLDITLSDTEKDAMVNFVQNGGFLFIQQDHSEGSWFNPAQEVLNLFGINASETQTDDTYSAVGSHQIVTSTNSINTFQGAAHSIFSSYGSDFTVLANDGSGDPVLIVKGPGSGIVVASTDIDMWSDNAGWTDDGSRDIWENIWIYALLAQSELGTSSRAVSGGDTVAAYRQVAFPASPNPGLLEALEAILGPYDNTQWRVFAWNAETKSYVELNSPDFSSLGFDTTYGKGYFVIVRNDTNLTIDGRKLTGDVYVVVLEGNDGTSSGGWNLIGNPFDGDVAFSNIEVFQEGMSASVALSDSGNTLTTRVLKEWVNGQYVNATVMVNGGAYWVRNLTGDDVMLFISKGGAQASLLDKVIYYASNVATKIFSPLFGKAIAQGNDPPAPPAALLGSAGSASGEGGGGCTLSTGEPGGPGQSILILLVLVLPLIWIAVIRRRVIRKNP